MAGSVWDFLTWSACCADTAQSPGPLSLTLVGGRLSEAAVCGACGTGHSGWPLVAENIPFLGEQGLVCLQSGRISPCLDLSVARVVPRGPSRGQGSRGCHRLEEKPRPRRCPAVTPHVISSHLGPVT